MRKLFEIGGLVAAAILIAFGVAAIVMGVNGRSTVETSLVQEKIVGSPDMTPEQIRADAKEAGLPDDLDYPTMSVADLEINSGDRARAFAGYMRIHALEATGGYTYAQMGQYTAKPQTPAAELAPGGGTSNREFAVIDPVTEQPQSNGERNVWVTETALATALNSTYMAAQLSLFAIIVGVALLLAGLGFAILSIGGALRNPETVRGFLHKPGAKPGATVTPAA
jgi:multisubunit Na+/H+ antiporter MnhC subunit